MKKLYSVSVYNESESIFKEYYTEEEIQAILKFFKDMRKHEVPLYDFPVIEFEFVEKNN